MRRVWLDHAAPQKHPGARARWLVGSGGLAALLIVLAMHQVHARSEALEADASRLRSPYRQASAARPETAVQQAEMMAARHAMAELALPWEALFRALERSRSEDVQLLSVDPDAKRHRVRLSAEATEADAMLAYIRQLDQQPMLRKVLLLQHERGDASEGKLRFTIEAEWVWSS